MGACGRPAAPVKDAPPAPAPPPTPVESTEVEATGEVSEPSPEEAKLSPAEATNAFAFDMYAKLRGQKENFTFSPASIMAALAMTQGGASGETQAEMAKVLHLDQGDEEASFAVGDAFRKLGENSPGLTLRIANRLFGEKQFGFEPAFLAKTEASFGAPLEPMDFRKAAERSRKTINDWVSKQTEKKIENLIPMGGVSADTRLVLVNAIYFLGKWDVAFTKERTSPAPFHLASGAKKDVPTMHDTGQRLYGEAEGVKLLELGYRESEFAMTFVLPDANTGIEGVEAKLSPSQLSAWVSALGSHRTEVSLPKFRIEPSDPLSLGKILGDLGMKRAFDRAEADFTKMANPKDSNERLSISDVFHKAFVAVDEEGTEAAAATAVVMRATSAMMPPPEPAKVFRADRPFLFFLRHKPSGAVLFMGKVVEPS